MESAGPGAAPPDADALDAIFAAAAVTLTSAVIVTVRGNVHVVSLHAWKRAARMS